MIQIREERPEDIPIVHALNASAFETDAEANLVDVLRTNARPLISLVALDNDDIVGHIMFSPVELDGTSSPKIMGLAPMAVAPDRQRSGIGSELVSEGLVRCDESGASAVVVLGHPDYYPRFGFVPASTMNIECEYDVPDEVFMVLELAAGCLAETVGTIRYHEAFAKAI